MTDLEFVAMCLILLAAAHVVLVLVVMDLRNVLDSINTCMFDFVYEVRTSCDDYVTTDNE